MIKTFQAGIRKITFPYEIDWTKMFVTAKDKSEAEYKFEQNGFYRNLVVREVISPTKTILTEDLPKKD